ncbi:sulfotransferase [Cyanothece sp. BG0011]|uniref:sulfotransferase n=1 Tax=Cyanothece sp. BG0011 TaxID=2082950 RepID=UPI000D1E17C3|nr:sulfotransferase [Cyanothece sp. BG0011]
MRDPRKMMASKKYVHAQDGDTRDYHPLAYANYWKIAYNTVKKVKNQRKAEIFSIKFEDLVADSEEQAEKLARFLDTTRLPHVEVKTSKQNTSFAGKKRTEVTDTEVWICEKIAGEVMKEAGYDLKNPTPKLSDLADLLQTSIIFLNYRTQQMLTDRSKFKTIMSYLKTTFSQ